MKDVNKATIEKIVSENGGSENQIIIAAMRYDKCKTPEDRKELLKELEGKFGEKKSTPQNKAVTGGDQKGGGNQPTDPNAGKVLTTEKSTSGEGSKPLAPAAPGEGDKAATGGDNK